ncbi:MAG TPA: TIM barrel protein [Planctomycetota bacterium]|nr:TIM barrel protein [Planctomycetota bacterium]
MREVRRLGWSAVYCPVDADAPDDVVREYVDAASDADLVIAEVGAWSNPLDPDDAKRAQALDFNRRQLALADRVGARCCVNISGSRGTRWDGPHADNLTEDTFDRVVQTVRAIIDDVKPKRTYYTLETMPWMFPDSVDSYVRLIEAVDRERFGVHLDPVNLVSSPVRYFRNAELIRECFARLGPHIRSCHAKDIRLDDRLTTHLDEVRPGLGVLDYRTYLVELDRLDVDMPLMLEHMKKPEDFAAGAEYIRGVAAGVHVTIR